MFGNPLCNFTQSTTIDNNSKSLLLVLFFISLSIFTFNVLFAKSIITGLFSSGVGLFGSSEYITLPNC